MEIEALRAQLEELFELDELKTLCEKLLGFEPEEVGGTTALGSFARSLSNYCLQKDAVQALADAVMAEKPKARDNLQELAWKGLRPAPLTPGARFEDFTVSKLLGRGPTGTSYQAEKDGQQVRLKVLHSCGSHATPGVQRFLALSRWVAQQADAAIPGLSAGYWEGQAFVAHQWVSGPSLKSHIEAEGPLALEQVLGISLRLLDALKPFHEKGITHGNLKPENVIIHKDDNGVLSVVLEDAAADRIASQPGLNGHLEIVNLNAPSVAAPEVVRGQVATPASDVYAVGVLLYLMLTGKLPFSGASALELAMAHLSNIPAPPSGLAPAGRVDEELEGLVLELLDKNPEERPQDAAEVSEAMERVFTRKSQRPPMPEAMVQELIDTFNQAPEDAEAAVALEAAVEEGAPTQAIARAFLEAFEQLPADDPEKLSARLNLAFRAGRLFRSARLLDAAESVYAQIVELDAQNPVAVTALEDLRRQLGKHEELIESWLGAAEDALTAQERAESWNKIGALYEHELEDPAQAVIAYTQAFCESLDESTAQDIERLAGADEEVWSDVLGTCAEAATKEMAQEDKNRLYVQMGHWYGDKLGRADLALQGYQTVLATDPANEQALEGLARIYRRAQQWDELAQVLLKQVDIAATPAQGRDIRYEVGKLYATKLNDLEQAREILESVLDQDPTHEGANDALAQLHRDAGDYLAYAKLLETRADAADPEERLSLMVRAGGTYEAHLGSPNEAMALYQAVVSEDPSHTGALRGLDRLYGVLGQYDELLANLQHQLQAAATPRQKLELYERIAGLYEEEFLSPTQAAESFEAMLEIDDQHENAMSGLTRAYQRLENWENLAELYQRHAKVVSEPARKVALLLDAAKIYTEQFDRPEQAIEVYEAITKVDPQHKEALEALARLRQTLGDADQALSAIDALIESAETPQAKVEGLLRAAKLLKDRGDLSGAAERYKSALELTPADAGIASALRATYIANGEVEAAADSLKHEIAEASSDPVKVRLNAELARLAHEQLKNDVLADQAANAALKLDANCTEALSVLGDISFEAGRFLEAASHFEKITSRMTSMPDEHLQRNLLRYVKALVETDAAAKALDYVQNLVDIASDDLESVLCAADVTFQHGDPQDAEKLYAHLIEHFDSKLDSTQTSLAHYRHAESVRRTGDIDRAISLLEDAIDLDPTAEPPIESLAKCYEAKEDWEKVWALKNQLLDACEPEARSQILVDMGELAATKLDDRTRATKSYVAALDDKPGDRKLLTRLMQLYSEDKDWSKLVEVVEKLAEFQEDPIQKAKYLMTAGMVNTRELGNYDQALDYFGQVLQLDPSIEKAVTESVAIYRERGDYDGAERLLKRRAKAASKEQDTESLLKIFNVLADLYTQAGRTADLVDALEALHTLQPDDRDLIERLSDLYRKNSDKYFDKAVALQTKILEADPYRADAYKALRKLYTTTKHADGSWCLCQALYVLNLAEPDEEKFFARMRSEDPAYAQEVIGPELWPLLTHPDADALLTRVFGLIESAVIAGQAQTLAQYGYHPELQVDLPNHHYPIGQTIHYAAGVMGIAPPPSFENTNDPAGLVYLHTSPPALSMGRGVLDTQLHSQSLAFVAGRHLAFYRPGFYMRQLLPTAKGLKSWLFAAIRMISPQFPVSTDLQEQVTQAQAVLNTALPLDRHDELANLVSELLQNGASLDLKRWIAGVDLSADRLGFLLAHDLETSLEIIRASKDPMLTATPRRVKDLVLFAISPGYLELRQRLGIALQ